MLEAEQMEVQAAKIATEKTQKPDSKTNSQELRGICDQCFLLLYLICSRGTGEL